MWILWVETEGEKQPRLFDEIIGWLAWEEFAVMAMARVKCWLEWRKETL